MLKRIAVLLAGILFVNDLLAATPNPYPNEVKGLRFYTQYLSPLKPLQSNTEQVEQVLGSDHLMELKDWRIGAYYSCGDEDFLTCSHRVGNQLLNFIEITPKHTVSMLHVKFPTTFSISYGGVSEINVTCKIYEDKFGLQYWVVSSDFPSHKNGELLMIRYGPNRAAEQTSHRK